MGFLSGVLEGVKDDENVKHYYPVDKMNETLQKIKESMHNPGGLSTAVDAVSKALGTWDGDLTSRTDALKNRLDELKNNNFNSMQNALDNLNALSHSDQLSSVADKLHTCIDQATFVSGAYDAAEMEYKKLDPELRDKLKDTIYDIKLQVKMLASAARNDELKRVVEFSQIRLGFLKDTVDQYATHSLNMMIVKLQNSFNSMIHKPVTQVKKALLDVKKKLTRWIEAANSIVDKAMKRVDEIMDKLNGEKHNGKLNPEKDKVTAAAKKLQTQAHNLYLLANAAKKAVKTKVEAALAEVATLDRAVRGDLNRVKGTLQIGLRNYVKENLLKNIKTRVGQIVNGDGMDGLNKVVQRTKTWASGFSSKQFDTTVLTEWIDGILQTDPVKGWIDTYAKNRGDGDFTVQPYLLPGGTEINPLFIKEIAAVINKSVMTKIRDEMTLAQQEFDDLDADSAADNIQKYVSAVQGVCLQFEEKLGEEIKEGTGNISATSITKEAQGRLAGKDVSDIRVVNPNLRRAVHRTLYELVSMAKHTGALINDFTTELHLGNIDKAAKVAVELFADLEMATSHDAVEQIIAVRPDQVFTVADKVESRIAGIFNQEIGETEGKNTKMTISKTNFADYLRSVTLVASSNSDPTGNKNVGEGRLPEAIGEIKRQVHDTHLEKIAEIGTGGDPNTFDNRTFDILFGSFTTDFGKFTSAVKDLVRQEKDNYGGIIPTHVTLNHHLDQLRTMLSDDVGKYFTELRGLTQIEYDLAKTLGTNHITPMPNTFAQILKDANAFEETVIKVQAEKTIADIEVFVQEEVFNATADIKNRARNEYHDKITAIFNTTQSAVTKYIRIVDEKIKANMRSGVKGLLRAVSDKHNGGKKLNELKGGKNVEAASPKVKTYFDNILEYVYFGIMKDYDGKSTVNVDYSLKVKNLKDAVDELLTHLSDSNSTKKYNYDKKFVDLRESLSTSLSLLSPSHFANPRHPELLDAVRAGLDGFVTEMERVYVNGYDGGEGIDFNDKNQKKYGAKVFLSALSMLCNDLKILKTISLSVSKSDKISKSTTLGEFFADRGYSISNKDKHHGELRNKDGMLGFHINKILDKSIESAANNTHLKACKDGDSSESEDEKQPVATKTQFNLMEVFDCLYRHLHAYSRVCHLVIHPKPKTPSNVYEMLLWLSGLTHNGVFKELTLNGFNKLFEKPQDTGSEDDEEDSASIKLVADDSMEAYPKKITAMGLGLTLTDVCEYAEETLVTILGHGHAGGRYACDFNTNPDGFSYPTNMDTLICLLFDFLKRIYQQLYVLYRQCTHDATLYGWRECWYGRGIAGSAWHCNTMQCANQACPQLPDQKANQSADQKTNQRCDQHPDCGLKSPLQSFLEDGLQGFLPHTLSFEKGKFVCSVKHSTMPCKTPMGFGDISEKASHRQKGRHIFDMLARFCGTVHAPLTKLCSQLNCVLPSAPQTFDAMFAFYFNFINEWSCSGEHRKVAFEKTVKEACFWQADASLNIESLQKRYEHSEQHLNGDLYTLVKCKGDSSTASYPCGTYMKPLCNDMYTTFAEKHADKYLSWIVYLTETFYDLLKKLYEECSKSCEKPNSKCHGQGCYRQCLFKTGSVYVTPTAHYRECASIVKCTKTLPTLCKYGMYYGSKTALSGMKGIQGKRTCAEYCRTLQQVVRQGNVLHKLAHEIIPEFLFKIREPFIWLNVALWSLSLFYLICVMVGRLDVLHIRSHLRIPSSHKITAQSLLAAAQVGRLAKISYLQP